MSLPKTHSARLGKAVQPRAAGFSMVELLVALVVISIGLLGIAKLQALSYGETSTSGTRGLATILASSMASSMRANRGFWSVAGGTSALTVTVPVGGAIASNDPNVTAAVAANANCAKGGNAAPCTAVATVAAYDLLQWQQALASLPGPGVSGAISCPTNITPINCQITVTWVERSISANTKYQVAASSAVAGFSGAQTYVLYVQP